MHEFLQAIQRRWNWLKIQWKIRVTGQAKKVVLEDKRTGKKHDMIVEQNTEKVCDHKEIREVAPTLWKCSTRGCPTYFQISYKVMLTERDLIAYIGQIAEHLKLPDPLDDTKEHAEV